VTALRSVPAARPAQEAAADAEFLRRIGRRIRLLRVDRGLSQEQLARAAGMSRNFVSSIERGVHGIDVVRLRWLAAVFEVSVATLVDGAADAVAAALSGERV
jgi:transcriptional regulator with XRE-family HTH domain